MEFSVLPLKVGLTRCYASRLWRKGGGFEARMSHFVPFGLGNTLQCMTGTNSLFCRADEKGPWRRCNIELKCGKRGLAT